MINLQKLYDNANCPYLQRESKIFVFSLRIRLDQGPRMQLLRVTEGLWQGGQPRRMQHAV